MSDSYKEGIEYLTKLKEKIEEAKESKARLEGSLDTLMNKLKNDFGYDTIEEAQEALKKLEETLSKRKERLQKAINNIKQKLGDID